MVQQLLFNGSGMGKERESRGCDVHVQAKVTVGLRLIGFLVALRETKHQPCENYSLIETISSAYVEV
jgi:hypothetical protein